MTYNPNHSLVGGFSDNDGTINFYLRVNALLSSQATVVDLGAGRAAWFEDDSCETRRDIRMLKGKVRKVIAADLDTAVLDNRASDEQVLMENGELKLDADSVDLIVADYVLEHITDPDLFVRQVSNCLKSGGWFCARTPHRMSYVSLAASLVKNSSHTRVLKRVQPNRKEMDVFPTQYKLNKLGDIDRAFVGWHNQSYIHAPDPAYFFGSKTVFRMQSLLHRLLPTALCGNIHVFVQKP